MSCNDSLLILFPSGILPQDCLQYLCSPSLQPTTTSSPCSLSRYICTPSHLDAMRHHHQLGLIGYLAALQLSSCPQHSKPRLHLDGCHGFDALLLHPPRPAACLPASHS